MHDASVLRIHVREQVAHVDPLVENDNPEADSGMPGTMLNITLKDNRGHDFLMYAYHTSFFNIAGEPIVCSPEDAIRTFFTSGLNALILGRNLVVK